MCFVHQRHWETPVFTSQPTWIPPISLSLSLFFISLIGNLSTLCEIKAENQCLVSNNFQTNPFHLFSPSAPPSASRSLFPFVFFPFLPPLNANRGSCVMTPLLLLSCSNNALKIVREGGMWQRGKEMPGEKRARNGEAGKKSLEWASVLICALMWMSKRKLDKYACCFSDPGGLHQTPFPPAISWRMERRKEKNKRPFHFRR